MVFTQVGDLGVVFYFFLISSLHLADQKIIFLRFQQILQLYRITDILSIVCLLYTSMMLIWHMFQACELSTEKGPALSGLPFNSI